MRIHNSFEIPPPLFFNSYHRYLHFGYFALISIFIHWHWSKFQFVHRFAELFDRLRFKTPTGFTANEMEKDSILDFR